MIKRIILWLVVSLFVFLVAMIIWVRADSTAKLGAVEARLVAAGAPMNLEALLPEPVADELNAASLYLELDALFESYDVDDVIYERLTENSEDERYSDAIYNFRISDAEWAMVDELMQDERLQTQLELIYEIAERHYFQPDWQYELGPAMMIPEVGVARKAAQLLLMDAAQAVRSNDLEKANRSLKSVIALSLQAEQCPSLISYLTAIAMRGLASSFLEAATLEYGSTAAFDPELWRHNVHDRWQYPMDGERLCMGKIIYEAFLKGDKEAFEKINGSPAPKKFVALRLSPVASYFRYDYVFYLEYMEAARAMDRKFFQDYAKLNQELDEQMFASDMGNYMHMLSKILIPALSKVREVAFRSDTQNIINRTALQVGTYKEEHGEYPEQLDALVPEYLERIPVDLFNGEPLIYRLEGDSFALYSVGPNFRDDNGVTNDQGTADEDEGDLIWAGLGSSLSRN